MENNDIGILILAAGASSRMGMPKQMLPVKGVSLLSRTIVTALETGISNIVVVLGSNADEHRIAANDFPVTTIINHNWKDGMASSIRAGINHFKKINAIQAIVILVCDQPTLTSRVISKLIEKYKETGNSIIGSRYSNTLGVPALFTSNLFNQLLALEGEHGAKKIILQNPDVVSAVDFPSGEIDIDTPEDYDNFVKTNT